MHVPDFTLYVAAGLKAIEESNGQQYPETKTVSALVFTKLGTTCPALGTCTAFGLLYANRPWNLLSTFEMYQRSPKGGHSVGFVQDTFQLMCLRSQQDLQAHKWYTRDGACKQMRMNG